MDEEIDTLMIDVRASTDGFRADIETMRTTLDTSLVSGFEQAGSVLERGLLSAIRRGSLGFEDLKSVALRAMNEIAASALQSGLASLFGGSGAASGSSGLQGLLGNTLGALFGLPGRATGGPVSPGSAYLVGERGPEVFVPTSAGRIDAGLLGGGGGQEVLMPTSASRIDPGAGSSRGGPGVFVPMSAGRIDAGVAGGRDVRVSINLAAPRGSENPAILRRSTRQVASAVARAMRAS